MHGEQPVRSQEGRGGKGEKGLQGILGTVHAQRRLAAVLGYFIT